MSAPAPRRVLVICTGNICRSPMGEAFLRVHLAARGLRHVTVSSAGTHAQVGRGVLPAVLEASATIGDGSADRELLGHTARQIDIVMARSSDLILCATSTSCTCSWWPGWARRACACSVDPSPAGSGGRRRSLRLGPIFELAARDRPRHGGLGPIARPGRRSRGH
jgi:protein-tyrosine-phosphatase